MSARESNDKQRGLTRRLLGWYRREARDLPWRRTRDPYTVWAAEIILQQTRIEQGTPYFERFMAAFPTVEALAEADGDAVLKVWEGLGYYGRARRMQEAAKEIVHARHGRFPSSAEDWRRLPGVGRYTAGAIASIALGERTPVLDGNVKRVLARVFRIEACIDDAATTERLWAVASDLVPASHPGDFNQALMELGARVCTPQRPQCSDCPIRLLCEAYASGHQLELPVRRARGQTPHREMVAAVIRRNGRYLIAKRPSHGLLAGLWEFPSGEVRAGESHEAALRRIAQGDLGVDVCVGGLVAVAEQAYSHFHATLTAYRCACPAGRPAPVSHVASKWVRRSELERFAFPRINQKILAHLL